MTRSYAAVVAVVHRYMEDVTIVGMTKNHAAAVLHAVAVTHNYTMMDVMIAVGVAGIY